MSVYEGCQKCLLVSCCSQICEPYKQAIKEQYDIIIESSNITLAEAENSIILYVMYDRDNKPMTLKKDDHGYLSMEFTIYLKKSIEIINITVETKE